MRLRQRRSYPEEAHRCRIDRAAIVCDRLYGPIETLAPPGESESDGEGVLAISR
jgi:hypothetical protein